RGRYFTVEDARVFDLPDSPVPIAVAASGPESARLFTVEDARVFDLPDSPVPIAVAASGPESARLAAEVGDGLIATEPNPEVVEGFRQARDGGAGSTWNQIPMCFGTDADEALER